MKRASPFWKGLISSSPVVLHWLRWKPGTGSEILLGRDKILGLENLSILSPLLRSQLESKSLHCLAQVKVATNNGFLQDSWCTSSALQLPQPIAREWDSYTRALKAAGISLVISLILYCGQGGMDLVS
jgi:hypothetical protein